MSVFKDLIGIGTSEDKPFGYPDGNWYFASVAALD